ncbi:hypothetical protein GW17_00048194 [Ensete ventricosum]|nr:hypothetical protein GW17_00048194 [Ensete ventricosum]
MSGVEMPPNVLPTSNSGSVENYIVPFVTEESRGNEMELDTQHSERIWSDVNSSQDFGGGMMKIVPSDTDVSSFEDADLNNISLIMVFHLSVMALMDFHCSLKPKSVS